MSAGIPRRLRRTLCLTALALGIQALHTTQAPLAAQTGGALELYQPVIGTLDAGESLSWTYAGRAGEVISISAVANDALDPVITLAGSRDFALTADDYDYPTTRDALLQAVTLPRTENYTITLTGYEGSFGDYRLLLTSGFAQISATETFDSIGGWASADEADADEPATDVSSESGTLQIRHTGQNSTGVALNTGSRYGDFAARVQVVGAASTTGTTASSWVAGIVARAGLGGQYRFEVNSDGLWRFVRAERSEIATLRDWIGHPNIVAGAPSFTLSLFARGSGFDFFYNDGYIGSVADTELPAAGQVGLLAGTRGGLAATTSVVYDDLVITEPLTVDGVPPIPQQIPVSDAASMALWLTRQHVVRAEGELFLTVPSASVTYARAGINRFMLAPGSTFTNFALGGTFTQTAAQTGETGCALVSRFTDERDYLLAFLDATGGHALAQRSDDAFDPSVFGLDSALARDPQDPARHLLVIADDTIVYYYIDGRLVGTLTTDTESGQVGIAVVNYTAIDTTCQFSNLWLWRWE